MTDRLFARLRDIRRMLHQCPETEFALAETRDCLSALLREAGVSAEGLGGGLVAELGSGPRAVLLRADMDALPVHDGKDTVYRSRREGFCHACGHDGHMAMLLGALFLLREQTLPGRVRFMFQPAEECPPGGALAMIDAGVLADVAAAFALHVAPTLPLGTVGVKAGELMAAADNFRLTITGRGGHGAMPHQAVDAVVVSAQVIAALQALVSRQTDPLEPLVVTVGKIQGGTASNVVADRVVLEGTVRTLDASLRAAMPGRLRAAAEGICRSFGAGCELEYCFGYPVLVNDAAMADLAEEAARAAGAEQVARLRRPMMGGEDFAYILERVPGCFIFLGTRDERFHYPLHHPRFDFDERVLPLGAELLARLAQKALL